MSLGKLLLSAVILLSVIACSKGSIGESENEISSDSIDNWSDYQIDSIVSNTYQYLLGKFNESSILDNGKSGYHLMFYSGFGYGHSIKLLCESDTCRLSTTCLQIDDYYYDCRECNGIVDATLYGGYRAIMEEFDFWTEDILRYRKYVLDGHVHVLVGVEFDNSGPKKRVVVRHSPEYDKIASLCYELLEFSYRISPELPE